MKTNLNKNQSRKPLNHEVNSIMIELHNKNKRSFPYYKGLYKQAQYFSPFYRDFIAKLIANKSLKIVGDRNGFIEPVLKPNVKKTGNKTKLSRKKESRIHFDISDPSTLPHEIGHFLDFLYGRDLALSTVVLLKGGKTLHEIFSEEFNSKQESLYQMVMNEYKNIINSNINDKAYDILINNMETYRTLCMVPIDKNKMNKVLRKALQIMLYENGFVETYYYLYEKKCNQILNDKYSPILDALSSIYDFNGLLLNHHDKLYYSLSSYRATFEFFANTFEAKVSGKYQHMEHLIKLLPKSFEAFEELFDICYQHIMNNKRFTDVLIKQRGGEDDEL